MCTHNKNCLPSHSHSHDRAFDQQNIVIKLNIYIFFYYEDLLTFYLFAEVVVPCVYFEICVLYLQVVGDDSLVVEGEICKSRSHIKFQV